jgi:hypothetical protein
MRDVNNQRLYAEEPTSKTITIRTVTWKRLQKYGTYGSTFDSILTSLIDRIENKDIEVPADQRGF